MTSDDAKRVGALIVSAIKTGLSPGYARIRELERRVQELEQRPTVKYCGVWNAEVQNNPGELVTSDGSVWHCNIATRARPGQSNDWTLAVKRGRDR